MLRWKGQDLFPLAFWTVITLSCPAALHADEADARRILNEMSDYMDSLESFGFGFDAEHELVSSDGEKLGLRSSGHVTVQRPDRLHIQRHAGFSQLSFLYDGRTLAVQDTASGLRAVVSAGGGIDGLVDVLRDTHGLPLPAADLIISSSHEVLMEDVSEVKDLGIGVVNGVECDHFAFRNPRVGWQIWIARGNARHPCLMIITSRNVVQAPQYRITITSWRETANAFQDTLQGDAYTEIDFATFLSEASAFPPNYLLEDAQ